MNAATLNQLMVDRAVGELPPDVIELLDAYLPYDARAADQMADVRDTVELAGRVLAADTATNFRVRPFPKERIAVARTRGRAMRWIRPLAMAACLGLAFVGGMKWNRGAGPTREPPSALRGTESAGFWAAATVRAAVLDHQSVEARKTRWSSPLRWPAVGEQS